MPHRPTLTIEALCQEAGFFSHQESRHREPTIYGVTDGKAVGTYFEHKFKDHISARYTYRPGSSASGIDFPELAVDMKVTSAVQPQSSCPFKSARQKVFGLGYSLLVFVYTKTDDPETQTGTMQIQHTIFVESGRTADFQMTRGLQQILDSDGNEDDLAAFMMDRLLPADELEVRALARELLAQRRLEQGFLTISNALQWRLQYGRVISAAGSVDGVIRIR